LVEFPRSEKLPDAFYTLGVLYQDRVKDFPRAIAMYSKLYETYPDHPAAANGLFMTAFLQHNELKNLDAAKTAYQLFLERYPESPLVESARFELANLGKDPADMLSTLEK
jgi:TolA-binding protein